MRYYNGNFPPRCEECYSVYQNQFEDNLLSYSNSKFIVQHIPFNDPKILGEYEVSRKSRKIDEYEVEANSDDTIEYLKILLMQYIDVTDINKICLYHNLTLLSNNKYCLKQYKVKDYNNNRYIKATYYICVSSQNLF